MITYLYNINLLQFMIVVVVLGREHTDEKVLKMLNDSQMIEAYIRKGESEIHWEGNLKKRKHFELIELLLENYPTETKKYYSKS